MIKAIFFDFDGVLTTDPRGSYTTCVYLEKKTGIPKEKIISCYRHNFSPLKIKKLSYEVFWQEFCKCIGKDIDIGLLQGAFDSTPKNEKMFELAEKLKTNYKTGIITDNTKERFDAMIEKFCLDKLFDVLILSAEVGCTKQEKSIFFEALKSLNIPPEECIFIDNTESNLIVPKQMGFKTIFYNHEKNNVGAIIEKLKREGIKIMQ